MKRLRRFIHPALTALLVIVVAFQFLMIWVMAQELGNQNRHRVWDTKLIFACYNYQIQPCDDAGVQVWNKLNPDKAVTEAYLRDPNF